VPHIFPGEWQAIYEETFSDVAHRNDCLTLHCRYLRWGTIWVYERIQLNAIFRQNKYQPELHWP